ncbi:CRISPR-associated endonuclease Cas1 [Corynebacterium ciconiae DSM 44920]|uniref:type II CRISPR-associated endonuclease Cas1 n=1 Tax=Corynebacterium ciconiae TaxID=227319 RepID=UPI00037303EE|nr:type II CRISPR-associated endonuclease Cas1 [Corynebacterium ciconiae]WKD61886.1 CRISPR-associated endonuclease Cas1 [Corynebacterium ciconiae DSM 44920]
MHSGWRVVDCSNLEGSVRYRRGQLSIQPDTAAEPVNIPLSHIAVVIIGTKVNISGAVFSKLSEYDIALIITDWRGVPVAGANPWNEHTRIGARQQSQASLSQPRRKQAWARIVSAKIHGQAAVARALNRQNTELLMKLSRNVRSGDVDNKEAVAARAYWRALAEEPNFRRQPGTSSDGFNSALDYGYTLLRGTGMRAVAGAGLAGTLGVFHHGRANSFALVDDLMEPFRPFVDQFVFSVLRPTSPLSADYKHRISSFLHAQAFNSAGQSVATVFDDFAQQFGLYVEGTVDRLQVPRWEGQISASEGQ